MKIKETSVKLHMAGVEFLLVRDDEGQYILKHGSMNGFIEADTARALGRAAYFSEHDMQRLGLLPEPPAFPAPRVRTVTFVIPEGAPDDLIEVAADYATKFIPMMIRDNMASLETRLRKIEVDEINRQWAEASDRFVNGTKGIVEHD